MTGNPYLAQRVYQNPEMIDIRNTEAFEMKVRMEKLESILYMLSSSVLAGETEEAQEYAYLAQKLLRGEINEDLIHKLNLMIKKRNI